MLFLPYAILLSAAAASSPAPLKVPFEKYTLPNGMKVILHVDRTVPLATINTWFYVGSKDEPVRRSGFAHLFEHLMFMGTERVPGSQFDIQMEAVGAANNASTSQDRTNYYSFGRSNSLPLLLWLDADRMEDLGRMMDQQKLDLQREVVRNERRETTENTPYGRAYDAINGLMYPAGHPYATTVIGSHEDLEAASVGDVKDFFARFYVPNNASLVVAGDFDPKKIKPLIAQYFGTLPRQNDVQRRAVPVVKLNGATRLTMTDKVGETKVIMTFHSPASYKPGDIEARMLANLLSDESTGTMYRTLVAREGLATSVSAFQDNNLLGGIFYVEATLAPGKSVQSLEAAIDRELKRLATEPLPAADLKRIVARQESAMGRRLQSLSEKADMLNEFEFYFGQPDSFERVLSMYRNVSPADIMKTARKVFTLDSRVVLTVVPEMAPPDRSPRDQWPSLSSADKFKVPAPTTFMLKNGIEVSYWSRPGVPLLSLVAVMNVGTWQDPTGREGLASASVGMLTKGAGSRDEFAFSAAVDQAGAEISATTALDHANFRLEVPVSLAPQGLALLTDVLVAPRFDASSWRTERDTILADITQKLSDPLSLARIAMERVFFGATDAYGRPAEGTISSVQKLQVNDVKEFWSQSIRGLKPKLFVASGSSPDQVKAWLDATLGTMPVTHSGQKFSYQIPAWGRPRLAVVNRTGAPQTAIQMILPGVSATARERAALAAVTMILGGSFTSRLNRNLREEKGYTYGAGASLDTDARTGMLRLRSAVRADVTGASITEFLKEIDLVAKGELTQADLEKAQQQLRTAYVNDFATLSRLVSSAANDAQDGISSARRSQMIEDLQSLTLDELKAAAKKFYSREGLKIVLVGDQGLIESQIKSLGLPSPEIFKP